MSAMETLGSKQGVCQRLANRAEVEEGEAWAEDGALSGAERQDPDAMFSLLARCVSWLLVTSGIEAG
jgi:hypothetical protein